MTLDLSSILNKDKDTLFNLHAQLIRQGWAKVQMPDSLVKILELCIDPVENFFKLPYTEKKTSTWNHVFGFTSVTHKQSFRWLTSDLLQPGLFPTLIREYLSALTNLMDSFMLELISSTGTVLFNDAQNIGKKLNIPLLQSETAKWSMLDIAYYLNDEKKFEQSELIVDENCAPHYDPGLLSLSVLSTHIGLELYDPITGQWVPHTGEDRRIAVLWCGKAALEASSGLLRPAVHRVTRQLDKPRLAIWYEICTFDQVPEPARPMIKSLEEELKQEKKKVQITLKQTDLPETKKTHRDAPYEKRTRHLKKKRTRHLKSSQKKSSREGKTGIPITKSGD